MDPPQNFPLKEQWSNGGAEPSVSCNRMRVPTRRNSQLSCAPDLELQQTAEAEVDKEPEARAKAGEIGSF